MAANTVNPRFPHFCVVRRFSEVDSFTPDNPFAPDNLDSDGFPEKQPSESVVYAGICRRGTSTNIRSFRTGTSAVGQVNYADFRVSIPGRHDIRKGDIATISFFNGEDRDVTVLQPGTSGLRTKLYPDGFTEFFYNNADI